MRWSRDSTTHKTLLHRILLIPEIPQEVGHLIVDDIAGAVHALPAVRDHLQRVFETEQVLRILLRDCQGKLLQHSLDRGDLLGSFNEVDGLHLHPGIIMFCIAVLNLALQRRLCVLCRK